MCLREMIPGMNYFTRNLITKLQDVGACVCVGESDAHRGLQEHQVGLCGSLSFSKLKRKHHHSTIDFLSLSVHACVPRVVVPFQLRLALLHQERPQLFRFSVPNRRATRPCNHNNKYSVLSPGQELHTPNLQFFWLPERRTRYLCIEKKGGIQIRAEENSNNIQLLAHNHDEKNISART